MSRLVKINFSATPTLPKLVSLFHRFPEDLYTLSCTNRSRYCTCPRCDSLILVAILHQVRVGEARHYLSVSIKCQNHSRDKTTTSLICLVHSRLFLITTFPKCSDMPHGYMNRLGSYDLLWSNESVNSPINSKELVFAHGYDVWDHVVS